MNPVTWRQPISVVLAAAHARSELLYRQVADTGRLARSQVLDSAVERSAALLGHLYLTPPSFAETENYRAHTSRQESICLSKPWNRLLRSYLGAWIWMFFSLLGIILAALRVLKEHDPKRRLMLLALSGTLFQAMGLIITVPLPWQRYVVPLIPFLCLWVGIGVSGALAFILNTRATCGGSPGGANG